MNNAKQFDVVVFGATGFTGALVARYLLQSPEQGLTWAIAGRNAKKLETVKQQLKEKLPGVSPSEIDAVPVLVADSSDEAQLRELVQKTKVVLTVVGPYKLYGELLVKVCAESGVHYCDLTGEITWVKDMITKYETAASKSGAILVSCCGFDAVPSDLTAFVLVDAMKRTTNAPPSAVTLAFTTLDTKPSGGTLASTINLIESSTAQDLADMNDPYVLTSATVRAQSREKGLTKWNQASLLPENDKHLGVWTSFFVGATGNQSVVHRSNYLQKNAYGDLLVYRERSAMGGLLMQLVATVAVVIGGVLLYFSWTRAIIKKFVLQPGEGPSEKLVENGKMVAKAIAYDANGQPSVRATVVGRRDPFYGMTSMVIAECAICLAKREVTAASLNGGFFTPASAFGHHLVERLDNKKIMTFDVQPIQPRK